MMTPDDYTDASDAELILDLETCGIDVPHGLPESIVARGSQIVPALCAIVTDPDAWVVDECSPLSGWAPEHAICLLGAIGDPSAAEALLTPFTWDGDWSDSYLNDGPGIFAHLGPGALPALTAFARDDAQDYFARRSVFDGTRGMAILFPEYAEAPRQLAREVADAAYEHGTLVPAFMLEALGLGGDEEGLALARKILEDDKYEDQAELEWTEVERVFHKGYWPRDLMHFTQDPMLQFSPEDLALWHQKSQAEARAELQELRPSRDATSLLRPALTLPRTARPERNAPCPCGSGKKYKKCCMP